MNSGINYILLLLFVVNTSICHSQDKVDLLTFNNMLSENGFLLDSVLNQEIYNENWRNKNKIWYIYDSAFNMVSRNFQYSYGINPIHHLDTFIYNNKVQINEWSHKYYSKNSNEWINTEKKIISYDLINRATDTLTQKWNDTLNLWENYEKRTLEFDNNGNLTVITWFEWKENQWEYLVRTVYNYENNLIVEEFYEEWHGYYWYSKFRDVYKYDDRDNNVQIDSYKIIDNEWRWESHLDHFFDNNHNLIKIEINNINEDTSLNMWAIIEYIYNLNGRLTEEIHYLVYGKIPEKSVKKIYEYVNISNNLLLTETKEWKNDEWISRWRTVYSYHALTDVYDFNNIIHQYSILPNPASEYIEIIVGGKLSESSELSESLKIQIYNIYGEQLFEQVTRLNQDNLPLRIDVSGFPNGIYFIRIAENIQKFVVLR